MKSYQTQTGSLGYHFPSASHVMTSGPNKLFPSLHMNITELPDWYWGLSPETMNPFLTMGEEQITTERHTEKQIEY